MALIDNLVSYWKLEEGTGTRVDSHGSNNLTGTTRGAVTGKINNGEDFERTSSDYLTIADASQTGLDLSGDLSFSFWLKLEELPSVSATVFRFLDKQNGGTTRSYTICSNNNVANSIECECYGDGTTANRRIGSAPANTFGVGDVGFWRHIVVTFDVDTGNWLIYKDGISQTITTNNAGTVASIYNSTNAFTIGARSDGTTGYLDGVMDEVGVWSRTLSGAEVTELYNSGAGLAYPFTTATRRIFIIS